MLSRQNGRFSRTVLSALATLVAAAAPTLMSTSAFADPPASDSNSAQADAKPKPEKHAAAKKSHAVKGQKAHAKTEEKKPAEATAKTEAKQDKAASKGKKSKKTTASRNAAGAKKKTTATKKADSDSPRQRAGTPIAKGPCFGKTRLIDRGGLEGESLSLVDCKGAALETAREHLSVLARPWGAARPSIHHAKAPAGKHEKKNEHAPVELGKGVRLVDPGLVSRVEAIARKFPDKAISVVSGYRPASKGSLHQSARALDLRVAGVTNEELVAFCKTLQDTGCGYYPNSSFVHVDVRTPGTGSVTWIDASGPGEAPRYVTSWPPPAADTNDGSDSANADTHSDAAPADTTYDDKGEI